MFFHIFFCFCRAVDDQIFFTYEDGRSALASLELNGKEIDGVPITVTLKSAEAISKTDPSINSLISLQNDDSEVDEHGFSLSDLLTHSRRNTRSNSILLPEKLDEQADFMDDDDARSVDDVLEEESDEEFLEEDAQEMLFKRQQEMIDSDEEEEVNRQLVERNVPERPSNPPQRPSNPPKRPSAPPKRPAAPSKPPRPTSEIKTGIDQVVPEREVILKSQASFSEFDPLQNKPEKSKPERPARPKQAPAKPPPPRSAVKRDETSKEEAAINKQESTKNGDETVSFYSIISIL